MFESALIKIAAVFSTIIALTRLKLNLWISVCGGIVLLSLWNGVPYDEIIVSLISSVFSLSTCLLGLSILIILLLSRLMKESGSMDKIVESYRGLLPWPKLSLMTLPMMVGMLPMPGGAVFSAPLVDAYDPRHVLGPVDKAASNFWFRHTLELCWPLYFAFIFIVEVSSIQPYRLIFFNLIFTPTLMFCGYLFLLKKRSLAHIKKEDKNLWEFANHVFPILLAVFLYFLFSFLFSIFVPSTLKDNQNVTTLSRYLPIVLGLSVAIGVFILRFPHLKRRCLEIISKKNLNLVWTVVIIKVFAATIQNSNMAEDISNELTFLPIPKIGVIVFLPFLAGLVTGVGFAYVGIAFPIVMSLFPEGLSSWEFLGYIVLADVFGYAGMMLSPLHVCMILTAGYFNVSLFSIIKKMIKPLSLFLILAVLYISIMIYVF